MIPWLKYFLLNLGSRLGLYRGSRPENGCPFCGIAVSENYRVIQSDRNTVVVLSKYQVRPGHLLILPRRHVASFCDLEDGEISQLSWWTRWADRALVSAGMAEGVNIAVNDGEAAGQTVPHVHVHVLPRRRGDLRLSYVWANPALLFSGSTLSPTDAEDFKKRICSAGTPPDAENRPYGPASQS
jgi:diadenosine tetraphosphate (Ap4A) HIT family hydrolase